jgi:hypothetical protein
MDCAVMRAAQRDYEFIAGPAAERARLQIAKMVRVGWSAAADEARLFGDIAKVLAVAITTWRSDGEDALVDTDEVVRLGTCGPARFLRICVGNCRSIIFSFRLKRASRAFVQTFPLQVWHRAPKLTPERWGRPIDLCGNQEFSVFKVTGSGEFLRSKGIDYFEKRELIEIGVAGANSRDTVFAHKNGGVRVVEQIAGKVRQLQNDLFGDGGVPFGWDKNCKAWRGEQRGNEIPSRRCAPWPSHDARVGCHAQKLIEDRPSGVPCIRSRPLAFEPVAAGGMKLRVRIRGVDQHIGVDGEH